MLKKIKKIYGNTLKPNLKRILIGLIIFFFLFTLIGFFVLPPILKSILTKQLSENLHREVTIQQIKVNPYTLSITARGLLVKERSSPETFVSCDEIFLNFQSLSAIRLALIFSEIRFIKPYLNISRHQDLSYNFSDLIEKKEPEPPKKEPSKPLRFSFNNIKIEDGSIDLFDEPKKIKHTVRELNFGIPFFSNIPYYIDTYVQPEFSAKINDTPYRLQGKTKPFADTLETSFDINISDLDIPYYLAYLPMKMNFKVVTAYLDTQTRVSFVQSRDKKPSIHVEGDVVLKEIAINDLQNKPLFRLPQFLISIAPSEPLAKRIHLSKISIQSPELEIKRDEKAAFNIQSLLPENKETIPPAGKKEENSLPLSLDVDEIFLTGGKIHFSDLSTIKPFKMNLDPIELRVDHFSNGKDKNTAYALSMKTESKENIKLEGEFFMDPQRAEGVIEVKPILLKKYSPYYQDKILFNIEEGRLELSTHYKYAKGQKEPEITLSGMTLLLSGLQLKKEGEDGEFLKIPILSIKDTVMDLTKRELKVGSFSTQNGELLVQRFNNGDINFLKMTPPPDPKELPKEGKPEERTRELEKPWVFSLKQMSVDNYTIHMEDQTPSEPVTLVAQNLKLKGENLSTAKNSTGKFSLSLLLNGKATISLAGPVGIDPLTADLKTELKNFEIAPFQSYFTDKVKITVTDGAISTGGNLMLTTTDNKELKITYKGEASLNNFSSIDKLKGEDFLKWESLSFNDLNTGFNPLLIDIKGISLTDFYARAYVNQDGVVNLQDILKGEEAKAGDSSPTPPRQEAGPAPMGEKESSKNIKVDTITLQGGKIDFSDKSLNTEFSLSLSEIGGRVSGLSSGEDTTADVELRAKLNDYAPLEITGKINPLRDDLFVDLKARIKDLDLSPATPYSGKYVGYTIEKGKLSFDLNYLIVKRKLDSQNNIFIDQFTFGDKVESPQATKLPVKLAVALLKDRKGEIKLDLPVTGSLDDPKFKIWGIILKILVNLISKAATSPFSLLGALIGGGEELSFVEFDYGGTTLSEPNLKKIETLVKALYDRPSIKMDIEGHVDVEKDAESLKQLFFNRKIKAQKLKEMVKQGQSAVPVDEVKIESPEYGKYLKMAYKEEKFPKPKNVLGMAKDIPAPEMEKLMLTYTQVQEGDLRILASQRSLKVKDILLKSGQVEPERVFILEPKSLSPEKKEKVKDSRVDFKLK
jgi:uncharacterized protein involved in outer membrane biogenesis